jgi:hypothetical protein
MPKISRCPNGSRRNKATKKCEPRTMSKRKSVKRISKPKSVKTTKGIVMPANRIKMIMDFERVDQETLGSHGMDHETLLKLKYDKLKESHWKRGTDFSKFNNVYAIAMRDAL